MPRHRFLLMLIPFLMATPSMASYLRLVPTVQTQVDVHGKKIKVTWTIQNDGDEPARSVGLEFPFLNQASPLVEELPRGGRTTHTRSFPFSAIGVEKSGVYTIVYRVIYKDGNLYPFSAPHLIQFSLPPAPGRVLAVHLKHRGKAISLPLEGQKQIRGTLINLSEKPLTVEHLEPLTPTEIAIHADDLQMPIQLKASEERTVTLTVKPIQALAGSMYVVGLVAAGTIEGMHFSNPSTFRVMIQDKGVDLRLILMGCLLAASVILLLVPFVNKRRSKRSTPTSSNARPTPKTR